MFINRISVIGVQSKVPEVNQAANVDPCRNILAQVQNNSHIHSLIHNQKARICLPTSTTAQTVMPKPTDLKDWYPSMAPITYPRLYSTLPTRNTSTASSHTPATPSPSHTPTPTKMAPHSMVLPMHLLCTRWTMLSVLSKRHSRPSATREWNRSRTARPSSSRRRDQEQEAPWGSRKGVQVPERTCCITRDEKMVAMRMFPNQTGFYRGVAGDSGGGCCRGLSVMLSAGLSLCLLVGFSAGFCYFIRSHTILNLYYNDCPYNACPYNPSSAMMKLIQSFLGFKPKKSLILQQRNSILKLLLILNLPNLLLLFLFQHYAPTPYMDEHFHYPQFLHYHRGDYHIWDPLITTPPGLYHIQNVLAWLMGSSLMAVRAMNSVIFGNVFLVFAMKIYQFNDHHVNNITRSLNLALTPTIYFFNFLDYTDAASLAFITMAFYYCLVGSAWRMGLCSLLAVYVRQNNIIWCAYLLLYRIVNIYSTSISAIRGNIFRSAFSFFKLMLLNVRPIIKSNYVQLAIFPLFAYYLHRYNQGRLVFGDHEHHQPCFHPAQVLYLSLFVVINLPISLSDYLFAARDSLNRLYFSRHALAAYLFLASACIVVVDKWTLVHPFILADNRHYVFYIYRYFGWAKYPLCMVYPFCMIVIMKIIVSSNQKMVKFVFWVLFTLLYLVPTPLVELRYYAIPFVLLSFEIRNRTLTFDVEKVHKREVREEPWANRMIFTILAKVVINFVVFYVFLMRGFGENGQHRFIW